MLKERYTKMKFLKLCTSASLALALLFSTNLHAYAISVIQTWDLVDDGKHLDWGGSTTYSAAFTSGVSTWENYKSGVIRKDTLATIQDVALSDFYEESPTAGVTNSGGTIKFNTYRMEGYGPDKRQNVATHEIGHALGLGHNTSNDVMYAYVSTITALSSNDKDSYDTAYNFSY